MMTDCAIVLPRAVVRLCLVGVLLAAAAVASSETANHDTEHNGLRRGMLSLPVPGEDTDSCPCRCNGLSMGQMVWDDRDDDRAKDGKLAIQKAVLKRRVVLETINSSSRIILTDTRLKSTELRCAMRHYTIVGLLEGNEFEFILRCDETSNVCLLYEGLVQCDSVCNPPPVQAPPGVCSSDSPFTLDTLGWTNNCQSLQKCTYPPDASEEGESTCPPEMAGACCPRGQSCYRRECPTPVLKSCGVADRRGNLVSMEGAGDMCMGDKTCEYDDDCLEYGDNVKCFADCAPVL